MKRLDKVLIIDDDEVNNLFCKIVIEHSGITEDVEYCMSGSEALDYLESCMKSSSHIPDLILLDLNMPVMGGFDFLNIYHELGYDKILSSKISILSSSVAQSDVTLALKYNAVVDYVMKPLSEAALNRIIEKVSVNE